MRALGRLGDPALARTEHSVLRLTAEVRQHVAEGHEAGMQALEFSPAAAAGPDGPLHFEAVARIAVDGG
jgi:hypothetical protein